MGADKTYFEHEHITPFAWWTKTLGKWLAIDCMLAGLVYFVVRWFAAGVRPDSDEGRAQDT